MKKTLEDEYNALKQEVAIYNKVQRCIHLKQTTSAANIKSYFGKQKAWRAIKKQNRGKQKYSSH